MSDPTVAHPRCPDSLVQAIKERNTRGLLLYNRERGRIHQLEGDVWAVPASEGGYWQVDLDTELCPCEDFAYYGYERDVACKHIIAAAIARAKGQEASLPQDHPHVCIDGFVYIGYTDDEGEEQVEVLPCRRCAEEHEGENLAASRPLR